MLFSHQYVPGSIPRGLEGNCVQFVVGSHPFSVCFLFLLEIPVSLSLQKTTFVNSNTILNPRTTGLLIRALLSVAIVQQSFIG